MNSHREVNKSTAASISEETHNDASGEEEDAPLSEHIRQKDRKGKSWGKIEDDKGQRPITSWFEVISKEEPKQPESQEELDMEEIEDIISEIKVPLPEAVDKDKERKDKEEWESTLQGIMAGDGQEVLARHGLQLRRKDFRSLQWTNWLNDKIIEGYMELIKKRSDEAENSAVEVMSTFLYTKLINRGVELGSKETENWIKEDLRDKDLVFFPIHEKDHWSLILVKPRSREIEYFDSLRGSRNFSRAPKIIKQFMELYCKGKGEPAPYKTKVRNDASLQNNGHDCGVFLCQFAERLARGESVYLRQENMPEYRRHMTKELKEGSLQDFSVLQRREVVQENLVKPRKKTVAAVNKGKDADAVKKKKEVKTASPSSVKGRIKWPESNSKEWEHLDMDLFHLLDSKVGSAESKAECHPRIIYRFALERFGQEEKKTAGKKPAKGPSRRQKEGVRIREEINKLKTAFNEAPPEEKEGIKELQQEKLTSLRRLKRAESVRKSRRRKKKNIGEFLSQPYAYARKLLTPTVEGTLEDSKEKVEEHLKQTHSDSKREDNLPALEELVDFAEPTVSLKMEPPTYREFLQRLHKTRSKSAPGPNGIPYKFYKKCPSVARLLFSYLRGLWRKGSMSDEWRKAEGVFIPKEPGASTVDKFRTVSKLNVEGKLYFSLWAERLTTYAVANKYIDTRIQKGGVPGISGCLENTAIISQLIREARTEKKDLVLTWLDIANAYGSIPHKVIEVALERAHVPEVVRSLVRSYYDEVHIRFTTQDFTTTFQRVEKGIITGCTLSVVLFSLAMTMLVASVRNTTKGPTTSSGQQQENARLFMDDINTATEKILQTKYLLADLSKMLNWARMEAKATKCRALVMLKGEVSKRTVEINGTPITRLVDKPITYLGKEYNITLTDQQQVANTVTKCKANVKIINKDKLPGRYKAWILQHMLIPRTMWPLTIYSVPATKVEELRRVFTAYLKRWLGLPRSLTVDALYSKSSNLRLPFSDVAEETVVAKARTAVTYEQSPDECVRGAGISVEGGHKWKIAEEVSEAKSRLRMQDITGIANKGREGLGLRHNPIFSTSEGKERRGLIVGKVREKIEDGRRVRMAGLAKQGASTSWELPVRVITSRELITASEDTLRFTIKSVYDLLPTPENKNRWFQTEEHRCKLCEGSGSLAHILSGCKVALQQGRYRWRHNKVLRVLAQHLEKKRVEFNSKEPAERRKKQIDFVGEGAVRRGKTPVCQNAFLDQAKDWKLEVDLDRQLKIPEDIISTRLRPDMIMYSRSSKQIAIAELTVPIEERVEISNELKRSKYAELEDAGRLNGWSVKIWAVEVGSRGFPAASMATFLKQVGCKGGERRQILKQLGSEAEQASATLWRMSHVKEWGKK